MFPLLFLASLAFCEAPDVTYHPDIKVGVLQPAKKCPRIANSDCLIYANLEARIEGQPLPIVKTTKPVHFKLSSKILIPGFKKGLIGACKGEVRRITIPAELAYESNSIDGLFEPYSTWIVTVEIVEILDSSSR